MKKTALITITTLTLAAFLSYKYLGAPNHKSEILRWFHNHAVDGFTLEERLMLEKKLNTMSAADLNVIYTVFVKHNGNAAIAGNVIAAQWAQINAIHQIAS